MFLLFLSVFPVFLSVFLGVIFVFLSVLFEFLSVLIVLSVTNVSFNTLGVLCVPECYTCAP